MKNTLLGILFILCFISTSCEEKEYEEFVAPVAEILSTSILSDNECEIEIKINLGIGASVIDATACFQDITLNELSLLYYDIELSQEKEQTLKLQVKMPNEKHDYKVWVALKTKKNEYKSALQIVRFSEKQISNGIKHIELYIGINDLMYVDDIEKIGLNLRKGEFFMFMIYYAILPSEDTKTEVKLNGEIPVETEINYWGWSEDGSVSGSGHVPADIASGVYNVHVYIDDVEYIMDYKIKVMPGYSSRMYIDPIPKIDSYIGEIMNYFIIGDRAYYIHNSITPFTVFCFNLTTNTWENKQNISITHPYTPTSSMHRQRIGSGNRNYCLITRDVYYEYQDEYPIGIFLWEYVDSNDSWNEITMYPGKGSEDFTAFAIGENIYIGGGIRVVRQNMQTYTYAEKDFWRYNVKTKTWTRLENLPYSSPSDYRFYINSTATHEQYAFAFTSERDLWQYDSSTDKWRKLSNLRGGAFYRTHSGLLYHNNKLYIVGGMGDDQAVGDVWEYDITSEKWNLIDLLDYYFASNSGMPMFFYNNILYAGYGHLAYENKELFIKINIE